MAIAFLHQSDLGVGEFSRELIGVEHGVDASVIFVDAAAGQGPALHVHEYAELFFVLEGEARFSDGTSERPVGPGGIVLVSPEQPHGFVNPGPARLRQIDIHLSPRFSTRWLTPAGDD